METTTTAPRAFVLISPSPTPSPTPSSSSSLHPPLSTLSQPQPCYSSLSSTSAYSNPLSDLLSCFLPQKTRCLQRFPSSSHHPPSSSSSLRHLPSILLFLSSSLTLIILSSSLTLPSSLSLILLILISIPHPHLTLLSSSYRPQHLPSYHSCHLSSPFR